MLSILPHTGGSMEAKNTFSKAAEIDDWGNILCHIPTGETRYHPNAKPHKNQATKYYLTYCGKYAHPFYTTHNDDYRISSIDKGKVYEKELCMGCLMAYKAKWKKDYER